MRQSAILWGGAGVLTLVGAAALAGCPQGGLADCDNGNCDAPDGYSGGDGGTGDGASSDGMTVVEGGSVDGAPGCEITKDPADSPACVTEGEGVFVDASSSAAAPDGSRKNPYKTITDAVSSNASKLPRIYVCAGSYSDNINVDTGHAVSIYGGFACGSWSYSKSNVVKVAPASGYALEVNAVSAPMTIADIELDAAMATSATSPNSIAAFVHDSPSVTLKRATLIASQGFSQPTAAAPAANYTGAMAPAGVSAGDSNGGALLPTACMCVDGTKSRGGNGGGGPNEPTAGVPPLPGGGTAGMNDFACNAGGAAGADGNNASALKSDPPLAHVGTLAASGWTPSAGAKGTNGGPGQGGGGGGSGKNGTGGGGSGACGGCGGSGGSGGAGGGASIALLTFNAPVSVIASTLTSGSGGNGGNGSDALGGQTGGSPAGSGYFVAAQGPTNVGCSGGVGGSGGGGNGGGGGAAGVSFAILSSGSAPTTDGMTALANLGTAGAAGSGGNPGDTGAGGNNAGQSGPAGLVVAAATQKKVEDL